MAHSCVRDFKDMARHSLHGGAAVGYVRVSTCEQATAGISLDAQRKRIKGYCVAHGLNLLAVHADEGISGKRTANRPALAEALDQVCEERAVLVVHSLSRLARSTRDAIMISDRLDKAGAQLASLSESIDTSCASGRMFFRLMSALSEFESEIIGERTAMALSYKRDRGERWCNHSPYGFRFERQRLLPCPAEEDVLARMRELRESGMTFRAIAATLTDEGITNRAGSAFPHQTIAKLIERAAA